jgi:hypothetical protein
MKPQGRLALPKEIGHALAEAQLCALDGPGAAAAFGATGRSEFKQVGHPGRIRPSGPNSGAMVARWGFEDGVLR